jgi:hypothetical protein
MACSPNSPQEIHNKGSVSMWFTALSWCYISCCCDESEATYECRKDRRCQGSRSSSDSWPSRSALT